MTVTSADYLSAADIDDGAYLAVLILNIGWPKAVPFCAAFSERFTILNGLIAAAEDGSAISLHSEVLASLVEAPSGARKSKISNVPMDVGATVQQLFRCISLTVELPSTTPAILNTLYTVVDRRSFLDWGLTSDFDVDGRSRKRRAPAARDEIASATRSRRDQCDEVSDRSETYFEATIGSIRKLMVVLMQLREHVLSHLCSHAWSSLFDLGSLSSFLDLGSGYGKVVMHACATTSAQRVCGMECVRSRHSIAVAALAEVNGRDVEPAGRSDVRGSSRSHEVTRSREVPRIKAKCFERAEFIHCDAAESHELSFTHIYIRDDCFTTSTTRRLAAVLQRSAFYVLVSTQKPSTWWGSGLFKVQAVAKLSVRTTGGEGQTQYIYVNMEKAPGPC